MSLPQEKEQLVINYVNLMFAPQIRDALQTQEDTVEFLVSTNAGEEDIKKAKDQLNAMLREDFQTELRDEVKKVISDTFTEAELVFALSYESLRVKSFGLSETIAKSFQERLDKAVSKGTAEG